MWRPGRGSADDRLLHPGHSPDHAALVLAAGDDYACFSGNLFHCQSSSSAVEFSVLRRSPAGGSLATGDDGVGASHHAQWFTGHFAGPSCGWLEKDKQGDYRWREAGEQAADKGEE